MVTVYTTENCVQCKATMRQLDKLSIPYETESAIEHLDMIKSLGFAMAPVVHVQSGDHEEWWSGYDPAKIKSVSLISA